MGRDCLDARALGSLLAHCAWHDAPDQASQAAFMALSARLCTAPMSMLTAEKV